MMSSPVRVYVYDVTKGMARSMSPMLLGRQIEGVWHTGVCVFGNEFFFGSDGIGCCPPSGTILGNPDQVLDMGNTEIPHDLFMEFLMELGENRFRGDKYHLLHHNCNNFSDEVSQFLTGQGIPSHITSLPEEVMQTPFGQQMRPMIEQMMGQINQSMHSSGTTVAGQMSTTVNQPITDQTPTPPTVNQPITDQTQTPPTVNQPISAQQTTTTAAGVEQPKPTEKKLMDDDLD